MRSPFTASLLLGTLSFSAFALAKAPSHHTTHSAMHSSQQCASLMEDYENASKDLAMNDEEGFGDTSAVRQTMRDTQNGNTMAKARMTMDLLKSNGCAMPKSAPSARHYYMSAVKCRTEQLRAETSAMESGKPVSDIPACDTSKWEPER